MTPHESQPSILEAFSPPVRAWFRQSFGAPTPAQALGWPPIRRGEHTLILSPTGSGKTLAAFLWAIDRLVAEDVSGQVYKGVHLLYISPLKALNNDIERNLRAPLQGIREAAQAQGLTLPPVRVAVRTGDTPSSARVAMVRQPPHILITTPESLYLMLTSERARELFRGVRTVILDEIHTLCGEKRGVHLSLSLARLERLTAAPPQRIGLSATQRPLEEVARFLGGQEWSGSDFGEPQLVPRPVTIVDASYPKTLDLQVVGVASDFRELPQGSLWPIAIPRVLELIRQHHTTLLFCNSRRLAERTADRLNEQFQAEESGEVPRGSSQALTLQGTPKGVGMMGTGASKGPFRAHHGSISKEARLQMEADLKAGRLPALVGTSSLELGIDMGSVDLVVQLQAPKGVAQGLQRVGRSGHLVGQTSRGRIFPTHGEDAVEAAVVAQGILRGEVEATHTPQDCLDVLAQQIVAAVSVEDWDTEELYRLIRQSYAYRELPRSAFENVLGMLSGRFPSQAFRELRPRIGWDRQNGRLAALPGSRILALTNVGTIPDRGAFAVYLADRKTRIGELDEEFVYETRPGDVFMLGSQVWRALDITDDRVIVSDAPGALPRLPFWRGDLPWRPYELGLKVGQFRRLVAERLQASGTASEEAEVPTELVRWLQEGYALDDQAALAVVNHVRHQLQALGTISSDYTIIVELFQDALGDHRMVVHSPFGGRVNGPWGLALAGALRERTGVEVEVQANDDGILFRFPEADTDPPLDLIARMTPTEARERILAGLPNSALFGAQFRQNAARALLLPGLRPGKRTPFWLQRLRAKDLLQIVKGFQDFPILLETYRDCLQEVMDLPHLEEVLGHIQEGKIRVVSVATVIPSSVAAGLLFNFTATYLYEWDTPKAERQLQGLALSPDALAQLFGDPSFAQLLKPEAISEVRQRIERTGPQAQARSAEELALVLEEAGDLTAQEVLARCAGDGAAWLQTLAQAGRAHQVVLSSQSQVPRWVATQDLPVYRSAFALPDASSQPQPVAAATAEAVRQTHDAAQRQVLRRFLGHSGPVTVAEIQSRYPFSQDWLEQELTELTKAHELVQGHFSPGQPEPQWCERRVMEQIHRRTLTILRRQVQPVPLSTYVDFLVRWQHLHPQDRLSGKEGLRRILDQLRATPALGLVWERDILPGRVTDFRVDQLEELCRGGEVVWVASGERDPSYARVRFLFRGEGHVILPEGVGDPDTTEIRLPAREVWAFLKAQGSASLQDLQEALELDLPLLGEALAELTLEGLITNDSWQALTELASQRWWAPHRSSPFSTLEAQLAGRRLSPIRWSRARQTELRRRLNRQLQRTPPHLGQWSPVSRFAVMGRHIPPEERVARQANQLLDRYGIVTRRNVEWEEGVWDWEPLAQEYQRMELRGAVRRGYFVKGLPGIQYASPQAVERLRDVAASDTADDEIVFMNAWDPANILSAGEASHELTEEVGFPPLARAPGNYFALRHGRPVLLAEAGGARIAASEKPGEEESVRRAFQALLARLATPERSGRSPRRVTVVSWNNVPVQESPGEPLLRSLGFYRDAQGMTWEGQRA